jgi:hypothetical protein
LLWSGLDQNKITWLFKKKILNEIKKKYNKINRKKWWFNSLYSSDLKLKYKHDPDNLTNSRATRTTKKNSKNKIKGK